MQKTNDIVKRFSFLPCAAVFALLASLAQAQTRPNLSPAPSVDYAKYARLIGAGRDVDDSLISNGPAGLTIPLPGNPIWFLNGTHERRGARSSVWRGRGEFDRDAATLTQHEGLLLGT